MLELQKSGGFGAGIWLSATRASRRREEFTEGVKAATRPKLKTDEKQSFIHGTSLALSVCINRRTPTSYVAPRPLLQRFVSAVGVGGLATLADFLLLVLFVEVGGVSPEAASLPALALGAVVQFVGCRELVFRHQDRSALAVIGPFVLVELVTLGLNALLFVGLVRLVPLPYPILRLVTTFVVFVGFSFPAWHWVFRPSAKA